MSASERQWERTENNLNHVLDCSKFTVKTVVRTCHNKKNVNELLNNVAASAILNVCCVVQLEGVDNCSVSEI